MSAHEEVLIETIYGTYSATSIINAAGAYATNLARQVSIGNQYACLPFLGAYKNLNC